MQPSPLPLFPLNVVLFPGALLPLHVFEDRYKQLVNECLEQDSVFGVVLIRHGYEVGCTAEPHTMGTTARIRTYTRQDDGKMNVVVRGERRFRILSLDRSRPYLAADIEWVRDVPVEDELPLPIDSATQLFNRHVELLFEVINQPGTQLSLPPTPEMLSHFVSGRLRISLRQKQELLEMTSTRERLESVINILKARNAIQETFLRLRPILGPVHSDTAVLLDAFVPEN